MALTLEEIAQIVGVSRSTVSRVMNDQVSVRPEVRERVWKVVRETGYQPHAAARSLVTRRTEIVGIIIPETVTTLFADPFFSLFLSGVAEACNTHRYHLMLSLFNDPAGQEDMYRRVLGSRYLDGAVVASNRLNDPLIPVLLEDNVTFVVAGRHPDPRVHYVDTDNAGGARMAVEHLIRLGHRRIATITGPLEMPAGQDRLLGYRQAMEAHRLPVDPALIVHGDYTQPSGMTAMQRLLPASPTAVFAANDSMAIGAVRALRRAGKQIPSDVAIVGFDDLPLAADVEPALTTVRQPIARMGAMAVEVLVGLLGNPEGVTSQPVRVILPTELVVRDSCGALA